MASSSFRLKLVAVVGAASLVLAACGSKDEASPSSTSTPAPTSSEASTPETSGSETAPETSDSAPVESSTDSTEETTGGGTPSGDALKIGTLLPQTGSLAFLGPPEFAGVHLALKEINEAGGVLGSDVVGIDSDSGDTSTNIATQSVDGLLKQGVSAIVGAASSGVSFTVIDKITKAGVIQISPANTSPDFTTYDDNGLYFRTAPSDVLQGRVLGNLVVQDGFQNVAIMALDDPYGTGLATNVQKAVEAAGGKIVEKIIYDPKAASYSSEVAKVAAAKPDALVLIGFDETIKVVNELVSANIGPASLPTYFVDGNTSNYGTGDGGFPEGTLKGVKGTLPGANPGEEFKAKLLAVDPALKDFSYAGESYDATVVVALGAIVAKSTDGKAIAATLVDVTSGGTKCKSFAECAPLAEAGTDFDYDGQSGPIEFDANGDPTTATIGVYQYGADNKYTSLDFIEGSLT
ncbi:amino acid ABC transporter substrate-binding protein [Nakamurella silvestris]|nr:amino acid ABC transporter substrate-binding protein [Nakamurella silvestris]